MISVDYKIKNKNATQQTIEIMEYLKILPESNIGFEITQELIDNFRSIYAEIKKLDTYTPNLTASSKRYLRKLAGVSLLKESIFRGYKPKAGIVYAISNSAFEGYYKVGITQNLDKRLASYQTYDPLRRYKVEHYKFVDNMRVEEKQILQQHKTDLAKGEWIIVDKIFEIFPNTL